MELIFAYIKKYGVLEKIGLSFSPYYTVAYDESENILHISENNDFPQDFFDPAIISITGIVGNNGSGKSTAIYWLLKAFVDESDEKGPDGIILLKDDVNKRLIVYKGEAFRNIKINSSLNRVLIQEEVGRFESHIPCCYYSGHFSPYIYPDVDSGELGSEINISDKWLLIKDYQNFTAETALNLNHSLNYYLKAHEIQDAYRIAHFLMDKSNRVKIEEEDLIRLPRYIIISPNKAGRIKLETMDESERESQAPINYSKDVLEPHIKYPSDPQQELINSFINESFVNYIAENLLVSEETIKSFRKWINYPAGQDALQDLWEYMVETDNQDDFFLSNLLYCLRVIKEISRVSTYMENSFFYLAVEDSIHLYRFSEELLHSTIFLTCRFFDLSYRIDINSLTKLSSGERAMLNLLSRLYWYLTIEVNRFSNIEMPALLFLDEAEIGFHPDWQRKYLWTLIGFLRIFSENQSAQDNQDNKGSRKMQIIYTTHSPITLAELPKECVNFLEREGNQVFNRTADMPQTFGENVFELYRHSFFMRDGLLGKMAEEYIRNISDALDSGLKDPADSKYTLNGFKKRIGIIGDRRIRSYLLAKYEELGNEFDIDTQIAVKKMELEILEQLKKKRNEKD